MPCSGLSRGFEPDMYVSILSHVHNVERILIGPDQLQGAKDSNGDVLGCKSACSANLDGNQGISSHLNASPWRLIPFKQLTLLTAALGNLHLQTTVRRRASNSTLILR